MGQDNCLSLLFSQEETALGSIILITVCYGAGELEAETAALLEMEKVSDVDFAPAVLACLPKEDEAWSISPQERAHRRDFTNTRYADVYMIWAW